MKKVNSLLILILNLSCLAQAWAQQFTNFWNGRLLAGNTIEFSSVKFDTTFVIDSDTKEKIVNNTTVLPRPIRLNGADIQHATTNEQGTFPKAIAESDDRFSKYLIDSLSPLLIQLTDGEYFYSPMHTIINEMGDLAYYEMKNGIWKAAQPFPGATIQQMEQSRQIDEKLKNAIDEKIALLLEHCPKFEPLSLGITTVPYELGSYSIVVKGHQLQN
jgi:hypothetical protein